MIEATGLTHVIVLFKLFGNPETSIVMLAHPSDACRRSYWSLALNLITLTIKIVVKIIVGR